MVGLLILLLGRYKGYLSREFGSLGVETWIKEILLVLRLVHLFPLQTADQTNYHRKVNF